MLFLMRPDFCRWHIGLKLHGWLLGLSGRTGGRDLACRSLKKVMGWSPVDLSELWAPPNGGDAEDLAIVIDDHPCVWTDGSADVHNLADVNGCWGYYLSVRSDLGLSGFQVGGHPGLWLLSPRLAPHISCRFVGCCRMGSGPSCGRLFLLCKRSGLDVRGGQSSCRSGYCRLDQRGSGFTPLPLVKIGDLMCLIHHMIQARGPDTVEITKVKRHTTDQEVSQISLTTVRPMMLLTLVGCISLALVNDGGSLVPDCSGTSQVLGVDQDGRGGTVPGPTVWDRGGVSRRCLVKVRVNVDLASLLGLPGFLDGPWVRVGGGEIAPCALWCRNQGVRDSVDGDSAARPRL